MAELNFVAQPMQETPTQPESLATPADQPVTPTYNPLDPTLLENEDMSYSERYELYLLLCQHRKQRIQDASTAWHDAVNRMQVAKAEAQIARSQLQIAKAQLPPRPPKKHDWEV